MTTTSNCQVIKPSRTYSLVLFVSHQMSRWYVAPLLYARKVPRSNTGNYYWTSQSLQTNTGMELKKQVEAPVFAYHTLFYLSSPTYVSPVNLFSYYFPSLSSFSCLQLLFLLNFRISPALRPL